MRRGEVRGRVEGGEGRGTEGRDGGNVDEDHPFEEIQGDCMPKLFTWGRGCSRISRESCDLRENEPNPAACQRNSSRPAFLSIAAAAAGAGGYAEDERGWVRRDWGGAARISTRNWQVRCRSGWCLGERPRAKTSALTFKQRSCESLRGLGCRLPQLYCQLADLLF